MDIGFAGERRACHAGHRDQPRALALDQWHDAQQFLGLAGIRQRQQHVVARNHAEITMAGFRGMHKVRRRSRARHGGRDLARHVAGLAHAADDHPPVTAEYEFDGGCEFAVDPANQRADRSRFDAQRLATERQRTFRRKMIGFQAWAHGLAAVMMAQVYLT